MQLQVHVEAIRRHSTRVSRYQVTPDPGVIEINIQPASSWRESVDITFGLYEDAAQVRLGRHRFLVDGRHTGTGGGNHVVDRRQHAADSPSCAAGSAEEPGLYWQRHPSAVLFVLGHFIGPPARRRVRRGPA